MAAPNPDSFQRALRKFKQSLATRSPDLLNQFPNSSLEDLRTVCDGIQKDMGKVGRLRRMGRLQGFIEAMDQLGQTIEVFVNASELVCFIWGPLKFLLGIAKNHLECFDKLLDVYEKVGGMIPGLLAYRSMLEKHPPLRTVLEDYYSDILQFHESALKVFARPTWKKLFKATWKTFNTEFEPLIQSLANRRELLESEKGSASLYEISKAREEMTARHEETKQKLLQDELDKHKRRVLSVKDRLEAAEYQQDQEMASEARNDTDAGDWILRCPAFKHWSSKAVAGHEVLYLHGIPGAGKTTLTSLIISSLLDDNNVNDGNQNTLVAYFYVKHKQPRKDAHNGFLRAIAQQIVSRDPVLSDQLFDELASVNGLQLRSTKYLESLIATALESYQRSFIIIDGLDEAAPGEAAKSLNWLLSLVNGGIKEPTASLRVLCSGQRDGLLDDLLSSQPAIALESCPEHKSDIHDYCAQMGAEIRRKFHIDETMESQIVANVYEQANGMFLFAWVVLDNLLSQVQLSGLKREMEPGTFPEGIEGAYERVALRVLKEAAPAQRTLASTILGWVACAVRPLRWREIQSVFCIDLETATMNYEENCLRVSCKQLCGSLVDIHHATHGQPGPDDVVTIVHQSALEYLVRKHWINMVLEHAKAASFCFRYLTSEPFCRLVDAEGISLHARQGYYGFQDYAVKYCLDHFEKCRGLEYHEDTMRQTTHSAKAFLAKYFLPVPQNLAALSDNDIENVFSQIPDDKRERANKMTIGYQTKDIRRVIEQIRLEDMSSQERDIVTNVYGLQFKYKCPKIWCDYFSTGFDEKQDREKHVQSHERPFCCQEPGCFASQFGFDTTEKLGEHMTQYHTSGEDAIRFPPTKRKKTDSLQAAAGRGDLVAIEAFLETPGWKPLPPMSSLGLSVTDNPLHMAIRNGHLKACKLLISSGFKLRMGRGYDCIITAVNNRRTEIVQLVLSSSDTEVFYQRDSYPQTDKYGRWCLQACMLGDLDTIKLLCESPHTQTPLSDIRRRSALLPILLNIGSWIEAACGSTNSTAVVKYLLDAGFSNFVTPEALARARSSGNEDLVNLLEPIVRSESRRQDLGTD